MKGDFIMRVYSNEIVFRGHPDKVCDQISDALLDAYMKDDKNTRAGIECTGGKGVIFVTGEVTSKSNVDVPAVVHRVLRDVGYSDNFEVINNLGVQSPDIAQGVDIGGAGDQGMMFGYACDETDKYVPKAMAILQELSRVYDVLRKDYPNDFYADGKAQITGYYDDDFRLVKIKTFTISYQNSEKNREFTDEKIRYFAESICKNYNVEVEEFLINPTGKFLIGGFDGDAGLCLEENTLVATKKGLKKIKDIEVGQTVYTESGTAKVTEVVNNGIKDTRVITDEFGTDIEATLNHPFRVWNGEEIVWKYCGELKEDDILIKRKITNMNTHDKGVSDDRLIYNKKKDKVELRFDADLAYLLGWIVGDGNTTADDRLTFYFGSEDERVHLLSILNRVFGKSEVKYYPYQNDRFYILSKEVVKVFEKIGVSMTKSYLKEVPKCILKANDKLKGAFLSGLFDSDGSVKDEVGRDGKYISIVLTTVSKVLAQQVSILLYSMGILSTIDIRKATFESHISSTKNSVIHTDRDAYVVRIIGLNSIRKFIIQVGFRLQRKLDICNRNKLVGKWLYHDAMNYYISKLVRPLIKLDTKKEAKYFENYGNIESINTNRNYNWNNLDFMLDIYSEYKETEEYKKVKYIFDNFEMSKIKKIVNSKSNTYDISLDDDTHSFIANGFVVHNTGRKIVVDSYQSFAPVGGGSFSGKDPTKVDRSGAYKARQLAIRVLKRENLKWCSVQLSYAIGKAEPLAIYIDSDKGFIEPDTEWYSECTPRNMIEELKLKEISYEKTARFGHFGFDFNWEK